MPAELNSPALFNFRVADGSTSLNLWHKGLSRKPAPHSGRSPNSGFQPVLADDRIADC